MITRRVGGTSTYEISTIMISYDIEKVKVTAKIKIDAHIWGIVFCYYVCFLHALWQSVHFPRDSPVYAYVSGQWPI